MHEKMLEAIGKVGQVLNEKDLLWGVGASMMLQSYGLTDTVNDMDIVVATKDIQVAIEALDTIGNQLLVPKKEEYVTRHFYTYSIDGVEMDVMAGFRIRHSLGVYEFPMDSKSITKKAMINGTEIAYTSLEDWLIAYSLMIGRDQKVAMIKGYLDEHGIEHPELLERLLQQELPKPIIKEIHTRLQIK